MTNSINYLGSFCRVPMRLIVTSECNGECFFCHNEGTPLGYIEKMNDQIVGAAVSAALKLGIKRITISGGEPTLLHSLPSIVKLIREIHPFVVLSMTTNGSRLLSQWDCIRDYLDNIDISIHSLRKEIWSKSTKINPFQIISLLNYDYACKPMVNINTVIFDENADEILSLIDFAVSNNVSITFMPAILNQSRCSRAHSAIANIINYLNINTLDTSNTPCLKKSITKSTEVRVKTPSLSKILSCNRCGNCLDQIRCGEYFCALRVYPNGAIGNCRIYPPVGIATTQDDMIYIIGKAIKEMSVANKSCVNTQMLTSAWGAKNIKKMPNKKVNLTAGSSVP